MLFFPLPPSFKTSSIIKKKLYNVPPYSPPSPPPFLLLSPSFLYCNFHSHYFFFFYHFLPPQLPSDHLSSIIQAQYSVCCSLYITSHLSIPSTSSLPGPHSTIAFLSPLSLPALVTLVPPWLLPHVTPARCLFCSSSWISWPLAFLLQGVFDDLVDEPALPVRSVHF